MTFMNFYRIAGSACIGLVLAGCGGRDGDTTGAGTGSTMMVASPIEQLEKSGALPKLDRSDSLAGPDADKNGVRDDIDAYINATFSDTKQRAAVLQFARSMQSAVLVDPASKEATKAVSLAGDAAINCMSSVLPRSATLDESIATGTKIEAMTTNTKARLKAYLAYNKSQDGTVSSLPMGDTCE